MPSSVVSAETSKEAREGALEKYLERLRVWNVDHGCEGGADSFARIEVGAGELIVDPWGRTVLNCYFTGIEADEAGPGLVAHGLALAMKSMMDIQRLGQAEQTDTATFSGLQAELVKDREVGSALVREIQSHVQQLIAGGKVEAARGLTNLKNKISEIVTDAKVMIDGGESASEKLEIVEARLAKSAVAGPRRVPRKTPVVRPRRLPGKGSILVLKDVAPPVEHPRTAMTRPLTAGLLVTVAFWLALVVVPVQMQEPLVPMSKGDFPSARLIAGVESRPPSLFVTVKTATWAKLSDEDRIRLIDEVARIIGPNGYRGARIQSDTGRPLARWLRERGSMSIGESEKTVRAPAG